MEVPIDVQGLQHFFGEGEAAKQALFDIDLQVEPGSLTILMGPSGSGKTTLLTLMGCLRKVQDGEIVLLGKPLRNASEEDLIQSRQNLGFIFQAHNLHGSLTAQQNVRLGLEVHGGDGGGAWDRACSHLLELLGLGERLHYLPQKLSGGQKQRVAVARALVGNPRIVFADEPTAALDKDSSHVVVDLLKRLGRERGTTSVVVTHDNRILEKADRILRLEDGRLVRDEAR